MKDDFRKTLKQERRFIVVWIFNPTSTLPTQSYFIDQGIKRIQITMATRTSAQKTATTNMS